jgi:hypothetical protein
LLCKSDFKKKLCFISKFKLTRDTKSMLNPYNTKNREVLNENYNIQLPLIEKKRTYKVNRVELYFLIGTDYKKNELFQKFQDGYTFNKRKYSRTIESIAEWAKKESDSMFILSFKT